MDLLILTHAAAGIAALLLAAVALRARKRRGRHTRAGDVYFWTMMVLLAGGIAIGARHPGLSPFEVAVLPTGVPLLAGYAAGKLRPGRLLGSSWLAWHIGGMGGSVIGLVSAGLFQTAGRVVPESAAVTALLFALPSAAGTLLIVRTIERRAGGRATAPRRPLATG